MSATIVKAQQEYATSKGLAKLFEDLTTALLYARPADAAAFVSEEAKRLGEQGAAYRATPLNAAVDTEESAAAYWEESHVRQLLEVRAAPAQRPPSLPLGAQARGGATREHSRRRRLRRRRRRCPAARPSRAPRPQRAPSPEHQPARRLIRAPLTAFHLLLCPPRRSSLPCCSRRSPRIRWPSSSRRA